MPCNHKFQKYLNLDLLDFEPETLIVGSFNPEWPEDNHAEWFYGRTEENYFWDVLPRLYGGASLINATPAEWKQFCHDKKVALTDLISSLDDADPSNPKHRKILGGFSDKAIEFNFDDYIYVNIVKLLQRHPTIKNVYLTRGMQEAFWRHLWNPIAYYCSRNNLRERKILTPTADSDYHHQAHNEDNPTNQIPLLADYLLHRWQSEWHF